MKILFIKEKRSKTGIEGISTYLLNLCKILNEFNIPYLVLYNSKDSFYEKMINNNIKVQILDFPPLSAKNLIFNYNNLKKFRNTVSSIIKNENITHINLHFPRLLAYVEKNDNIPIIVHQHGADVNNKTLKYFNLKDILNPKKIVNSIYRKKVTFNFDKADRIICAGKSAVDTSINMYGVDRKKISVNMYGALNKKISEIKDIRSELGLQKDDKLIISIGRETKAKGVEDFCNIAKKLKNKKKYKFFYLGGYRDENYHNMLVEKYGNYVEFLGMKTNIDEYYKAADLMLFLSHREAGGMVLFESMSFSLPMIVWDTVGVNELVINNVNGYVSPFGDLTNVVTKLEKVLENDELYKKLSYNSNQEYKNKYNFKEHVERLLDTFRELNS